MTGPTAPAAKHSIGLIPCLAFAVGTMIGGGVFSLSGVAVDQAGPSALLAYLLAGGVMLLSALSFVVIASRAKPGESGYAPLTQLLGQAWHFMTAWGFYLNAVTAIAFVLVSFGSYLTQYFAKGLKPVQAALLGLAALALLNLGPADAVGRAETFLVGIKIAILLVLVAFGIGNIKQATFLPFLPNGPSSLVATTALLFTAYTGFNTVTNMAGEVRDAQRTVPRAIILSVLISAAIYMGVIVALLASGQHNLGGAGLAKAAQALMGDWGAYLVAFAACVSTLSGANANLLGSSELTIRLTAHNDVPPVLGRTTGKGNPFVSVIFGSAAAAVLIAVGGLDSIVSLSNVSAIFAMLVVDVGAFKVARAGWTSPGFRLPWGGTIPVLGFLAAAAQLPALGWKSLAVTSALMGAGYLVFSQRHRTALGGGVVERVRQLIAALETPLARALRRIG